MRYTVEYEETYRRGTVVVQEVFSDAAEARRRASQVRRDGKQNVKLLESLDA